MSLRALGYNLLWRCADAFQKAATGCLSLAAGFLRREELRAFSEAQWSGYNSTDDAVDAGLDAWERRLYTRYLKRSDRVLLIGCGAGRDLIALRREGFDITGLDHPALIQQAGRHLARHGLSARLIPQPVEDARIDGTYDAVLLSTTYSCILDSKSRIAALKRLTAALSPGGRALIGYNALDRQSPLVLRFMRAVARLARADWLPEKGDVFTRGYNGPRQLDYQHYFSPGDVERECAAAGLRVVEDQVEGRTAHVAIAVPNTAAGVDQDSARSARMASRAPPSIDGIRG